MAKTERWKTFFRNTTLFKFDEVYEKQKENRSVVKYSPSIQTCLNEIMLTSW